MADNYQSKEAISRIAQEAVESYVKDKIKYLKYITLGLFMFLVFDGIASLFGKEIFSLYMKSIITDLYDNDESFRKK